jgi:hypothetical protein
MNHTLQTALAWFGAISACGYLLAAVWICTALCTHRKPITESEIAAVDFDAELAKLTKENGR